MTLDELRPGETARVVGLDGDPAIVQRLASFGLLPEVEVEVIRRAPTGDPLEIELLGYRLSLRRAEAAGVRVERG